MGRGQGVFLKIKSQPRALGRYCIPQGGRRQAGSFSHARNPLTHSISLPGFPPDQWLGTPSLVQYLDYRTRRRPGCCCTLVHAARPTGPLKHPNLEGAQVPRCVCPGVQGAASVHSRYFHDQGSRGGGQQGKSPPSPHKPTSIEPTRPKHPPCAAQPTPPPSAHRALGSSFSSARLQLSRTEPNPFPAAAVPRPELPRPARVDGLPGFQVPSLPPACVLSLIAADLPRSLPTASWLCLSLDIQLPTRLAPVHPYACLSPFVCPPVCLPVSVLSCICVGRSSQLAQLNESSRFARFGVLRRSPKARGTGSQSLQTSMRPPPQSRSTLEHSLAQTLPSDDGGRTVCACASAEPQDIPRPAIWSLCHGNKLNLPGFEMSQASRAVPTSA